MTWLPTVSGLPVDLLTPQAHEVDFAEIAHALAHINRSSGNSRDPVSVGLHLLIGLDFCPTAATRAKWLLHDAHEARLGDRTSPEKQATVALAAEMFGPAFADQVEAVRHELEARHDRVIYAAALLPLPDVLEAQAIKLADLRTLATERRDFHTRGPAPRPWACLDACVPPIQPGPKVWRWLPPVEVETRLLALFRTHLPALQRGRRAS